MSFTYEFHHVGIPVKEEKDGERYSEKFKMYTTDSISENYRVQFHRFLDACPLHKLIQTVPHVAYKVSSLDEAIKNEAVIMEPYEPFSGFKVAMIEKSGVPIEFIETTLGENEIWDTTKHKNSIIYKK
jgi:hypothetical protein